MRVTATFSVLYLQDKCNRQTYFWMLENSISGHRNVNNNKFQVSLAYTSCRCLISVLLTLLLVLTCVINNFNKANRNKTCLQVSLLSQLPKELSFQSNMTHSLNEIRVPCWVLSHFLMVLMFQIKQFGP